MMALEAVRCIRKKLRTFENQPVWRVATPPSSALFRVLVVQVAAARVQDAIAKFRASVHQTFCNSFPEGHSKCGQRSKPRRVSVPLSWAQVPSCTGFSSRAARDLCPGCARLWKRFVPGLRRRRRGRREEVPRERHDSRLGRNFLPAHFGMSAHDGGISPCLGFIS
jgi:hypothetical protein